MELFKVIPENFFSLLSGKNRNLYMNGVFEVFKAYEQGSILGMDKRTAQQSLIDFLEIHPELLQKEEESETIEEEEEVSVREVANLILRRMEECEWIDVDVSNDYVEILNFRDYAITIIEAMKQITQDGYYGSEEDEGHEFRGYIYTAYTLLVGEHVEYAMVLDQVYRNTVAFVREIRKLDSRLKFYLRSIIERTEIRDLIHLLVDYKVELVDQAYYRLKTSDNINKYKLEIIKRLEKFQQDPFIMETIAREYLPKSKNNMALAKVKVNKRIDDMIDIYNALDAIIDEIDNKNKVYVNTTIAKIKFLLNDDENVIGKLTTILQYTAKEAKKGRADSALNKIKPLFRLATHQQIAQESIYTPRGAYSRSQSQFLADTEMNPSVQLQEAFYKEFETNYSEDVIKRFLQAYFIERPRFRASELLRKDMSDESVLRLLYILVYAGEDLNYSIYPLQESINHDRFQMEDFEIVRGYQP
ncbi:MAG: DUF5716 family protein [Candidatus Izemoplasmatales bacterium]|nr:DUF5716 family protein [Candidatus Izemoplasmatales bacterium]